MKASNATSAATFVSAIHISCNARLAFGCWLFGNLASTFAVLCTQQRCSRVFGQTSPAAFQNPSAPSAMMSRGGLDRLSEQGTCPVAQDFCELIVEDSWLNQMDDVIVGHGISLLRWRSGGVKHPHDMPPSRFPPSPTLGDSSKLTLPNRYRTASRGQLDSVTVGAQVAGMPAA